MKILALSFLLFNFVSCLPDRYLYYKHLMKEKIKTCVFNSTASDSLKEFVTDNFSFSRAIFSTIKLKSEIRLNDTDKAIFRTCRKEAFMLLKQERYKYYGYHIHGHHYENETKPSNQQNLRNLDLINTKIAERRKKIFTCIEGTSNISDNLKKFLIENKESELRDFFKAIENLTVEERKIVRNCRRQVSNRRPI